MVKVVTALFLFLITAEVRSATVDVGVVNLTGRASVIDGDTLEIHGTRIRLWGIDAPESTQLCRGDDSLQYRCGAKAANDLDAFIGARPVNCTPVSLDRYGRTVALLGHSCILLPSAGHRAALPRPCPTSSPPSALNIGANLQATEILDPESGSVSQQRQLRGLL